MWHNISAKEAMTKLTSSPDGLSAAEVHYRQKEFGPNRIEGEKKEGLFKKFINQFSDYMILILLAAAAVSFVLSVFEGNINFFDPVMILTIVILNACMGVYQERKAEKSLEALKKLSAPSVSVIRSGMKTKIPTEELVCGDIILLEAGDMISADGRLTESTELCCDESALTGESIASAKSADLIMAESSAIGDMKNMVWSGTTVTCGRGQAVVTATGNNTQMGKIARLISDNETPPTPLQINLANTGKILGKSVLIVCGIMFLIGILRKFPPFEMFMTSVSLAVAAIPEGLPAIVTVMLSLGVTRMARKNAIIRKLPAVETLGGATVICSDKTGTLTQNKMTVTEVVGDRDFVLTSAALCSNGIGATEIAISDAAENVPKLEKIREIPFDSSRKMMTVVFRHSGGYRIISKGGADVLLDKCLISPKKKAEINETVSKMAKKALRVLAVAYRDCNFLPENPEKDLEFIGLIGMIDPPRPEAKNAVHICRKSGIRPVMITGDHPDTARAIASELGILRDGDRTLCGRDLDNTSDDMLKEIIDNCSVFARVTPEHKMRIVKALQARGEIVAMTGDGVNDAPALKCADIGCAMGKGGTEVAKNAADMILTDDNFATVVAAISEGRGIYNNIRKAVHFLLSSNIGEILAIFTAILSGVPSPLLPLQLLWVNLVTDSFPAIALGMENTPENAMQVPPKRSRGSIFSDGLGFTIITEGIMIGTLALLSYTIGRNIFASTAVGSAMCFCVLSLSQLIHAYCLSKEKSVFKSSFFENKYMVFSLILCAALQFSVMVLPPLQGLFKVCSLTPVQWIVTLSLSFIPMLTSEIEKLLNK